MTIQNKYGFAINPGDAPMNLSDFRRLCVYGEPEQVRAAIKNGVDLKEGGEYHYPILNLVARRTESIKIINIIKILIEAGIDVNAQSGSGETALMAAVDEYKSDSRVINALLDGGSDVGVMDDNGLMAIDYAVHPVHDEWSGMKNTDVFRRLREASSKWYFSVERTGSNTSGYSFANLCAWETRQNIESAIKNGADVNARGKDRFKTLGNADCGITALMMAAKYNDPEVAAVLLEAGADVDARDNDGVTALMMAAWHNKDPKIISVLLGGGADIEARDKDGKTALMLPDYNYNLEIIAALLKAGANIEARDKYGWTILMRTAAFSGGSDVIAALLGAGSDVHARNIYGKTALILAACHDNLEAIAALLEAGADATLKDNAGLMAIDYAEENPALQGTDILQKLRGAGG